MMIVRSVKGDNPILSLKRKKKKEKKKKKKRKKENASYKNKGSEGIVTHESSHNNDVQDFKQYKNSWSVK